MNYLAHLYLSGEEKELLVGNFIADHVLSAEYEEYRNEFHQFFPELIEFCKRINHT